MRLHIIYSQLVISLILAPAVILAQDRQPVGKSTIHSDPGQSEHQALIARLAAEAGDAMRKGDYERAIQGYENLVDKAPNIAEFHADLGFAYFTAGLHSDAARAYRDALKLKPGLTHAHYFLGLSLAASGQCREALTFLEGDYPAVRDLQLKRTIGLDAVNCANTISRYDKALDFVRWLDRDFPDDPDVLYVATHIYSELSTHASQRLLFTAPGSYQARRLNAEVLEMQGRLDQAAAEYRKVLELSPRLGGIHYRLGRILLSGPRGKTTLEEAAVEFEKELKVDPSSGVAEYELGEMERKAGRLDGAIQHFTRATKLEAGFTEARIGLGKSLTSAGRALDAVAPLESAVKLEPENPVAHYQLSFAYRRLGREQDAEQELTAYRALHKKCNQTMGNIRATLLGLVGEPQTDEPPQ